MIVRHYSPRFGAGTLTMGLERKDLTVTGIEHTIWIHGHGLVLANFPEGWLNERAIPE
jgi:hypothetical protein